MKKNVSLSGINGSTHAGTSYPNKKKPAGSAEEHRATSNVETFSYSNTALSNQSWDFIHIKLDKEMTITITGCRKGNYVSDLPVTIEDNNAVVQASACTDKN